jgi:hypothetical protein
MIDKNLEEKPETDSNGILFPRAIDNARDHVLNILPALSHLDEEDIEAIKQETLEAAYEKHRDAIGKRWKILNDAKAILSPKGIDFHARMIGHHLSSGGFTNEEIKQRKTVLDETRRTAHLERIEKIINLFGKVSNEETQKTPEEILRLYTTARFHMDAVRRTQLAARMRLRLDSAMRKAKGVGRLDKALKETAEPR